jgi:hypothetical protein
MEKIWASQESVAHTYNPSCLGGWNQEDLAQIAQIVLDTPISKHNQSKWSGGVAHAVACLLCKHEALKKQIGLGVRSLISKYIFFLFLFYFVIMTHFGSTLLVINQKTHFHLNFCRELRNSRKIVLKYSQVEITHTFYQDIIRVYSNVCRAWK